jgi:biotin carboxyl carrier protein
VTDVRADAQGADRGDGKGTSEETTRTRPIEEIRAESAVQRAIRVAVAPSSRLPDEEPLVVGPPLEPLAPLPASFAGRGVLGGAGSPAPAPAAAIPPARYLVDGSLIALRLERRGVARALLHGADAPGDRPVHVVFSGSALPGPDGLARREVLVDGWRIELEIEPERRAALHERARRGREATAHGGPTEVRAIIPGRVVSVSVAPGDEVTAGQQILVVEAMKMQNELRAPRDGVVRQVGVAVGRTIEVGDLLLVIE